MFVLLVIRIVNNVLDGHFNYYLGTWEMKNSERSEHSECNREHRQNDNLLLKSIFSITVPNDYWQLLKLIIKKIQ